MRWRAIGLGVALLALAALAHAPLLGAGARGEDLPTLIGAGRVGSGELGPAGLASVPGTNARPLAALSLVATHVTAAGAGRWSPASIVWLRVENLLLLACAAFALSRLVRRALEPWAGAGQARAAGLAGALLFVVHPLAGPALARVASRGDLLALALGVTALALFLHGRQERRGGLVVLAALLSVAAGLASPNSTLLPFCFGALELVSARRHRPRAVRLRTAANTLVVFATCVAFGPLFASLFGEVRDPTPAFVARSVFDPGPQADALVLGLEQLGLLVLPVEPSALGVGGFVVAGVALLLALHPAFVAGRAAPRLWSWILIGGLVTVVLAQWSARGQRARPEGLDGAHVLVAACLVMSAGLGISATALSGVRRVVLPLAVVLGYALLSHAGALSQRRAAEAVGALRASLVRAAGEHGEDAVLAVIDPPREIDGVTALGASLATLTHPALLPEAWLPGREEPLRVIGLAPEAFLAWVREPEFESARAQGLVLLTRGAADASWSAGRVPPPSPSRGRLTWRGSGRSPAGVFWETWSHRALAAVALPGSDASRPPRVHWSGSGGAHAGGSATGAWIESEEGPVAMFDLGAEPTWLFSDGARALWFDRPLASLAFAEVLADVPPIAGSPVPREAGDDWWFDLSHAHVPRAVSGEASWSLDLFDLETGGWERLVPLEEEGALRVPGAARAVARARSLGARVVWSLERRVEGVCVARARGRGALIGEE